MKVNSEMAKSKDTVSNKWSRVIDMLVLSVMMSTTAVVSGTVKPIRQNARESGTWEREQNGLAQLKKLLSPALDNKIQESHSRREMVLKSIKVGNGERI